MRTAPDPDVLDAPDRLERADTGAVLRDVASAGARLRSALQACDDAGLPGTEAGAPRAVVVASRGTPVPVASVLAALAPAAAVAPVVEVGDDLPRWVGAGDVVLVLGGSGPATAALADAAGRRGARLVVAGADRAVVQAARRWRAVTVELPARAGGDGDWDLLVPALVAADLLGLVGAPRGVLVETADRLDDVAVRCRVGSDAWVNPAKEAAAALAGTVPLLLGTGPVSAAAGAWTAGRLIARAGVPALSGALPGGAAPLGALVDGVLATDGRDDVFRDRVDDPAGLRPAAVLLRDDDAPGGRDVADAADRVLRAVGAPPVVWEPAGASPLERFASLVGLGEFTSVYVALAAGVDPAARRVPDALRASGLG